MRKVALFYIFVNLLSVWFNRISAGISSASALALLVMYYCGWSARGKLGLAHTCGQKSEEVLIVFSCNLELWSCTSTPLHICEERVRVSIHCVHLVAPGRASGTPDGAQTTLWDRLKGQAWPCGFSRWHGDWMAVSLAVWTDCWVSTCSPCWRDSSPPWRIRWRFGECGVSRLMRPVEYVWLYKWVIPKIVKQSRTLSPSCSARSHTVQSSEYFLLFCF